jgi:hypothetical protein
MLITTTTTTTTTTFMIMTLTTVILQLVHHISSNPSLCQLATPTDTCSQSDYMCVEANFPFVLYYLGSLQDAQLKSLLEAAIEAGVVDIGNSEGLTGVAIYNVSMAQGTSTGSASVSLGNNKQDTYPSDQGNSMTGDELMSDLIDGINNAASSASFAPSSEDTSDSSPESLTSDTSRGELTVAGAVEMPSSGDSKPGAGTLVGATMAGVLFALIALFVVGLRMRRDDESEYTTEVKHRVFSDDDEEEIGISRYEQETAPDSSYDIHGSATGASSYDGERAIAHIVNDESDNSIETKYKLGRGSFPMILTAISSDEVSDPDHSCSSPNCMQCERKRQQTTVHFVHLDESYSERIPANASRRYAASDVVDL